MKPIAIVLLGVCFGWEAPAQVTITGTVTGSGSPLPGAGVEVYGGDSFGLVKSTLTEPEGTYRVEGLQKGQVCWVKFCYPDYIPTGDQTTAPGVLDAELFRLEDSERWQGLANKVVQHVKADPRRETFRAAWLPIESSRAPAFGKAMVARNVKEGLKHSPEIWSPSSTFKAYSEADPGELEVIEMDYCTSPGSNMPEFLNKAIVANIQESHSPWVMISTANGPCTRGQR